jgi:predicted transglutaminase-like cysteine proteinase
MASRFCEADCFDGSLAAIFIGKRRVGASAIMIQKFNWFFAFALVLSGMEGASAQNSAATGSSPPQLVTSGSARPVSAWADFCRRYPAECKIDLSEPKQIVLTEAIWKTLLAVNAKVNRDIKHVQDLEHWGVPDHWDMAEDGKGDTEEYVNVKKSRLVKAGLPRRSMLTTVVLLNDNSGHAILMVRTDKGDLILDNIINDVLIWSKTGYKYVKRESQDQSEWVSLGGVSGLKASESSAKK